MVTFVDKEWGDSCSGTQGMVVSKFHKQEQGVPVILLIIAKYPQVLFQGLIGLFGPSITFGMVSGGEVELHVKCFSKRAEKLGDELGTLVGGYMFGDAMLREDMHDEYCCKVLRCTMDCHWDENAAGLNCNWKMSEGSQ